MELTWTLNYLSFVTALASMAVASRGLSMTSMRPPLCICCASRFDKRISTASNAAGLLLAVSLALLLLNAALFP